MRTTATTPCFTRRSNVRIEMPKNRAASFGVRSRVGSGGPELVITILRLGFRQSIGGLAGGDLDVCFARGMAGEKARQMAQPLIGGIGGYGTELGAGFVAKHDANWPDQANKVRN